MEKFNRKYELRCELLGTDEWLTIELPFSIEFTIVRKYTSAPNEANIRIYNLKPETRDLLRIDYYDPLAKRRCELRAGYGDNLPLIFAGYMHHAFSQRENTNMITTITGYDGGQALQAHIGYSFGNVSDTGAEEIELTTAQVIAQIVGEVKDDGVKTGKISPQLNQVIRRGQSVDGIAVELMQAYAGNACVFIDNGVVNVLADNEVLPSPVNMIDASTGLLSTPIIGNISVLVEILFEPRIIIGQEIYLESLTGSQRRLGYENVSTRYQYAINGTYKVYGITHNAMISETVGGNAVTKLELQQGNYLTI